MCGPKSDTGPVCNAISVWTVISEFIWLLHLSRWTFMTILCWWESLQRFYIPVIIWSLSKWKQYKQNFREKYLLLILTSHYHLCINSLASLAHLLINERINAGFQIYFRMAACWLLYFFLFFWACRSVHDWLVHTRVWYWPHFEYNVNSQTNQIWAIRIRIEHYLWHTQWFCSAHCAVFLFYALFPVWIWKVFLSMHVTLKRKGKRPRSFTQSENHFLTPGHKWHISARSGS